MEYIRYSPYRDGQAKSGNAAIKGLIVDAMGRLHSMAARTGVPETGLVGSAVHGRSAAPAVWTVGAP